MKTQTINPTARRSALMAIVGVLFICGCATTSMSPTQYPFSAKGWNGMDSVEFIKEFRLEDYSLLVVEPLDTSATALPPKDENTYQPAITVLNKTDQIYLSIITRRLEGKIAVSDRAAGVPVEKTLRLRGAVAEIEPGSQAMRYWVGFGAGSAWVKIRGELVDAESGIVLLRFEQRRVSAVGLFGGAYVSKLNDCVAGIAKDVGVMIGLFKGL